MSLILYHFGFNIDRWVSLAIALLILSFGVEILFNVVAHLYGSARTSKCSTVSRDPGHRVRKETYLRLFRWIDRKYRIDILKSALVRHARLALRYSGHALACAALLAILYDMGFQLQMDEQAMVERFGKPRTTEPLGPGLHFKLPRPIDRVGRFRRTDPGAVPETSQEEQRPDLGKRAR